MRKLPALLLLWLVLSGCAGTGPHRSLQSFLEERGLPPDAPVVLVDLDDTVYEKALDQPMTGAPKSLRGLARDHLIVYLTARPTCAKLPGVVKNRRDSTEFLEANQFPEGPLFTSSVWNWLWLGEGGGKVASFGQLREFGVDRVALAVGDRPHDLEAYLHNGHVAVDRAVIILIESPERPDCDRAALPPEALSKEIPGRGPAWPRILEAYRKGKLTKAKAWVVSQPR